MMWKLFISPLDNERIRSLNLKGSSNQAKPKSKIYQTISNTLAKLQDEKYSETPTYKTGKYYSY